MVLCCIQKAAERNLGSDLKKLTRKAGEAKTHVRVVSDQRHKGKSPRISGNGGIGNRGVSSRKSGMNSGTNNNSAGMKIKGSPPKVTKAMVDRGGAARLPIDGNKGAGPAVCIIIMK